MKTFKYILIILVFFTSCRYDYQMLFKPGSKGYTAWNYYTIHWERPTDEKIVNYSVEIYKKTYQVQKVTINVLDPDSKKVLESKLIVLDPDDLKISGSIEFENEPEVVVVEVI